VFLSSPNDISVPGDSWNTLFPKIQTLHWFNINKECDWWDARPPSSVSTYQGRIANLHYMGNILDN